MLRLVRARAISLLCRFVSLTLSFSALWFFRGIEPLVDLDEKRRALDETQQGMACFDL